MDIGAKDSSKDLVAGSHRSFPQDSWKFSLMLDQVKRMIRGFRVETILTYSQTLNRSDVIFLLG